MGRRGQETGGDQDAEEMPEIVRKLGTIVSGPIWNRLLVPPTPERLRHQIKTRVVQGRLRHTP